LQAKVIPASCSRRSRWCPSVASARRAGRWPASDLAGKEALTFQRGSQHHVALMWPGKPARPGMRGERAVDPRRFVRLCGWRRPSMGRGRGSRNRDADRAPETLACDAAARRLTLDGMVRTV
jgi:hypothetical protein